MAGAVEGFGSRWHTVQGLRLHALELPGPGPAVLLLPGLVTASRSMVPLARALRSRDLGVWILDPPGFGYSDKPRRALSLASQAALIASWLGAVNGKPARVLGNSFGTQVGAALAAGHPGTVERLVLLSPTVAPPARKRLAWLRALPAPAGTSLRPTGRWRGRLLRRLHGAVGGDTSLRVLNVADYACASLWRAAGTLRGAVLEPIEQALPHLPVPVLVIRADHDRLSSLEWARRLARLAPEGELAELPGLGHDGFYRDPDAVAEIAVPFLTAGAQ